MNPTESFAEGPSLILAGEMLCRKPSPGQIGSSDRLFTEAHWWIRSVHRAYDGTHDDPPRLSCVSHRWLSKTSRGLQVWFWLYWPWCNWLFLTLGLRLYLEKESGREIPAIWKLGGCEKHYWKEKARHSLPQRERTWNHRRTLLKGIETYSMVFLPVLSISTGTRLTCMSGAGRPILPVLKKWRASAKL